MFFRQFSEEGSVFLGFFLLLDLIKLGLLSKISIFTKRSYAKLKKGGVVFLKSVFSHFIRSYYFKL